MLIPMTEEQEANESGGFLFLAIVGAVLATAWVGASLYKMITTDNGSIKLPGGIGGEARWSDNEIHSSSKSNGNNFVPPTVYVY